MTGLTSKDKEDLALLYERPEFRALKKWSDIKKLKCAEELLKVPMGTQGSSERIAMLQGQAYAHEIMFLELKKIHKDLDKD